METKHTHGGSLPPLLWLSLAFVLGVALAAWVGAPAGFWLAAAALAAAAWALLRRRQTLSRAQRILLLATGLIALGGLRYQLAQPYFDAGSLASYNDHSQQIVIEGVLAQPAIYHDSYVELLVQARSLNSAGYLNAVNGLLLARADLGTDWRYGDALQLSGWLRTPANFTDFSYREYLARQGVYSEMSFATAVRTGQGQGNPLRAALYAIRTSGVESLQQLYPDPAAGLLAGILLGDESGIRSSLKEAFNDTGTRHIVAISGFNISIIAGLFLTVFSRGLGARRGLWLAAAAVAVYTLLVGAQASVVRAAIMGLVALAARGLGREQFGPNTLAFTAAAMAAVNPFVLWDAGFQLSFMATLGLMSLGDRLRHWADGQLAMRASKDWAERLRGPLYDYVLLTLSAQIFTLPLLLHYFGRLSLISMPANLLILPLQPALMVLGGLSLLAAAIFWPLGQLFALAAWPLAALTIRIVEVFAGPSWAVRDVGGLPLLWVLAYYVALAVALRPGMLAPVGRMRLQPAAVAAGLALFSLWSWSLVQSQPDGLLRITLLDVPGEAVLVQTPSGRNLLINGGASAVELTSELGRHLPLFRRELDWLLLAGERPEQVNGLLQGNLPLAQVAWASLWPSAEFEIALDNFAAAGLPVSELEAGQRMDLGEGVSLHVWGLGTRGASLLLTWRDFAALLPFGLDFDQMDALAVSPMPGIDLLLLADEGYPALNTAQWLAAADAPVHWLAAGGEANADLLAALDGRSLMRVDELGWLEATTDGQNLWLSAERGQPALMQP